MHAPSLRELSRAAVALAAAVTAGVIVGCYEEHAASPQQQAQPPPPAPVDQPPTGGNGTGVAAQPGSALGGARRAAHNTVDSVEQRQEELEKALEDE